MAIQTQGAGATLTGSRTLGQQPWWLIPIVLGVLTLLGFAFYLLVLMQHIEVKLAALPQMRQLLTSTNDRLASVSAQIDSMNMNVKHLTPMLGRINQNVARVSPSVERINANLQEVIPTLRRSAFVSITSATIFVSSVMGMPSFHHFAMCWQANHLVMLSLSARAGTLRVGG